MHKSKTMKKQSNKTLTQSLSARISPLPSPKKHTSICFDESLAKQSKKSIKLKMQIPSSTVMSPNYNAEAGTPYYIKKINKSIPDNLVDQKLQMNNAVAYVKHLQEQLDYVQKENRTLEQELRANRPGNKSKVWKTVEKFKKKLGNRLK